MQKNISQLIRESKEDLKSLLEAKLALYKLQAIEKGVPAGVAAVYGSIIFVLITVGLGFLLFCGAFALSIPFTSTFKEAMIALTAGFGITSAIFIVPALIMMLLWKHIVRKLSNKFIDQALDKMEIDEQNKKIQEQIDKATEQVAEKDLTESEEETSHDANIQPIVYDEENR